MPFTPEAIAQDVIAAAEAGAAIAHIHVRDPITGEPDRQVDYYQEVVERVRASKTDVILNLTAGMGGDLVIGSVEEPLPLDENQTDLAGATERLDHVRLLHPEICTLDCGTMNFGEGNYVATNTHDTLAEMARQIQEIGTPRNRSVRHGSTVGGEGARCRRVNRLSGDGATVHGGAVGRTE